MEGTASSSFRSSQCFHLDELQVISSASESEELASSVDNTAGVYFVPSFSGLLAPRWRSDARGVLVGLTSYTSKVTCCTDAGSRRNRPSRRRHVAALVVAP